MKTLTVRLPEAVIAQIEAESRRRKDMLLTTDADFRIYRRHGRQTISCVLPR